MTQPSPPSSLEQEEQSSSNPRGSRSSRVSRSLSAMGFFQQSEDSSESTLSSSGRRDSASKDTLDPAAYGESTEIPHAMGQHSGSARIKSLVLLAPSARLAAALDSAFRKNRQADDPHSRLLFSFLLNDYTGVLTGAVGGNFGPFPRSSTFSTSRPPAFSHRDSLASSSIGLDPVSLPYGGASANAGADSPRMTEDEYGSQEYVATSPQMQPSNSRYSVSRLEGIAGGGAGAALLWEKEPDDFLHECVLVNRNPQNVLR